MDLAEVSTRKLGVAVDAGRAVCREPDADPDEWFPAAEWAGTVAYARSLCAGCPVLLECRELGVRMPRGTAGIWGGWSAAALERARKARAGRAVGEVA